MSSKIIGINLPNPWSSLVLIKVYAKRICCTNYQPPLTTILHTPMDKLECCFFQFNANLHNKTISIQSTQHETYSQEKQLESIASELDLQ